MHAAAIIYDTMRYILYLGASVCAHTYRTYRSYIYTHAHIIMHDVRTRSAMRACIDRSRYSYNRRGGAL